MISLKDLRRITGPLTKAQVANAQSIQLALDTHGAAVGLNLPHRLAQYLAQLLHESGGLKYDRELWGPTDAQKRYEGRKDLGNVRKGDGSRFRGRTAGQITGRANYASFTDWARRKIDANAPDFTVTPEKINTDPWEGLGFIWYWDVGNPDRKSLNRYADRGDIEMITRRVNGGLNGYADRLNWYDRVALVLLGYGVKDFARFQEAAKTSGDYQGKLDGKPGPQTRAALHRSLVKLTPVENRAPEVATGPVVEEKIVVPVNEELDKPWYRSWEGIEKLLTGGAFTALTGFLSGLDWKVVLAVGGLALVSGGAWYLIRERKKAQQEAVIAAAQRSAL